MAVLVRRAALIANPASRRGAAFLDEAVSALGAAGVECTVFMTERPGHAAELAATRCEGMDAVFVLGGDGTIMEVAGALAGTRIPIGVLAGGTGNLLARALGIPLRVKSAVRALVGGDLLRIDLGRLGDGRRFAVAAGMGIDARMVRNTSFAMKRRLGVAAYALIAARGALGAVWRGETFHVRLTVDGVVHERRAVLAMVANFGAVLQHISFGPGIRHDDGLLDACIFSPRGMLDAVRLMMGLLRGRFRSDESVLYASGREIRIETDGDEEVQADGELLGRGSLVATVEPLAADLLVPVRRQVARRALDRLQSGTAAR